MVIMTKEQLIQEEGYFLPYHYFFNKKSLNEIIYDSYISIVIDLVNEYANQNSESQKILDAGCGDGCFIYNYNLKANQNKNGLYGLDYSAKAINFAKIYNPTAEFKIAPLENTGYSENYFDLIVCIETLEHFLPEDLPKVIKEIYKILKPAGKFIITVPSDKIPLGKGHYQHFNYQKLENLLTPDFQIIKSLGNDKRNIFLKLFYNFNENKFYKFKHQRLINFLEYIYNKYGKFSQVNEGNRIILVCQKI